MIKFSNVSLIYPNSTTTVIEDLNLEIAEGELVLVIGPTGSGKSSLLRLINGLVPHHTGGILAGSIEVDGISTAEVKPGGLAHLIGRYLDLFLLIAYPRESIAAAKSKDLASDSSSKGSAMRLNAFTPWVF